MEEIGFFTRVYRKITGPELLNTLAWRGQTVNFMVIIACVGGVMFTPFSGKVIKDTVNGFS